MKDSKKNYITREWYNNLVAELKELREVKLPDILEKLAEAKAQWDLSENFEYKSAMEDKDFVNSKIAESSSSKSKLIIAFNNLYFSSDDIFLLYNSTISALCNKLREQYFLNSFLQNSSIIYVFPHCLTPKTIHGFLFLLVFQSTSCLYILRSMFNLI